MRFVLAVLMFWCSLTVWSQSALLQSGPMLGYNEMREVLLWVQTTSAAEVQFMYWESDQPSDTLYTGQIRTEPERAFTAKFIADRVMPGVTYDYRLIINRTVVDLPYPTTFTAQPNWKRDGRAPDFRIALGSCTNTIDPLFDAPNPEFTARYEIFPSIADRQPDLMLWLGDNIYLGDADWYTQTGILHRYTHTRSIPKMQELLATAHNYAIWDDHDFGPNNSDRSFIHKDKTLAAFELFWGNPTFGLPGVPGAISFFQYMDIDFFLLDNRYHRSPNDRRGGEKTILGKAQLEWLIDALSYSNAPYKMVAVGGQVLNTAPLFENYANRHFEERQYLLNRIEEEGITGVVFLTGDRHHTELSRYVNNRGIPVYDLTISPLTSRSYDATDEPNTLRVPGTHVGIQNFGILNVTGPRDDRRIQIEVRDTQGALLWEYEIGGE
ncbi:alkaline phosphatase D family protein [Flavilitoribacter nigricans]|uniref:Phosphodiesterase n=1 Tax=Flavilitoribacter nigricans (strain ATCC 23147 / DSM 23189 / NBRC 102662 / NCIMB 1420 / SS-2) TaxID=1122177 RepID=A0A2D0N4A7_FLAN2|nr:alkaline phosphatase D family protein [Flavilitoribacter nigricans]PHN03351.1 phosphodiesterase [Flavilitoribacter nigricans DSM 23189 = NBRC 102662]